MRLHNIDAILIKMSVNSSVARRRVIRQVALFLAGQIQIVGVRIRKMGFNTNIPKPVYSKR